MGYPAVYLFEECMREGMQIESASISVETRCACSTRCRAPACRRSTSARSSARATRRRWQTSTRYSSVHPARWREVLLRSPSTPGGSSGPPRHALPHRQRRPGAAGRMCDTFLRRNANISRDARDRRVARDRRGARRTRAPTEAGIELGAASARTSRGVSRTRTDALAAPRARALGRRRDPRHEIVPVRPDELVHAALGGGEARRGEGRVPHVKQFHLHMHDAPRHGHAEVYAAARVLDETTACQMRRHGRRHRRLPVLRQRPGDGHGRDGGRRHHVRRDGRRDRRRHRQADRRGVAAGGDHRPPVPRARRRTAGRCRSPRNSTTPTSRSSRRTSRSGTSSSGRRRPRAASARGRNRFPRRPKGHERRRGAGDGARRAAGRRAVPQPGHRHRARAGGAARVRGRGPPGAARRAVPARGGRASRRRTRTTRSPAGRRS